MFSTQAENRSHATSFSCSVIVALLLRRAAGCAAFSRRRPADDRDGVRSPRRSTRSRSSPSGSAGDDVARHEPDPAGQRAARPRARRSRRPPRSRTPTWCSSSTASSRPSTTPSTQVADGPTLDVADVGLDRRWSREDTGTAEDHDGHDPATSTRTSGRTRRAWPTFTDAVADALADARPRPRGDLPRQRRRTSSATWTTLDRGVRRRACSGCAARHDRGLATTRSATWTGSGCTSRAIAGLSPDAEPTPADLAAPAGADRGGRDHHRVLRAAGQPAG